MLKNHLSRSISEPLFFFNLLSAPKGNRRLSKIKTDKNTKVNDKLNNISISESVDDLGFKGYYYFYGCTNEVHKKAN